MQDLTATDLQAYNHIHGYSQLGIRGGRRPEPPMFCSMKHLEYVNLLNSFAFLLVFKPGERAATTVQTIPSGLQILWAKHTAVSPTDILYADKLIQELANPKVDAAHLMRILIPKCVEAMHQYAVKLVDAFGKPDVWNLDKKQERCQIIMDDLVAPGVIGSDGSFEHYLDGFVHAAANLRNLSEDQILSIMLTAGVLRRRGGWKQLDQLAEYYHAIHHLRQGIKIINARGWKVVTEHVTHPPTRYLKVKSATMDALSYGFAAPHKNGERPGSVFDKISENYPGASRGTTASDDIAIPFVQHPSATTYVASMQRKVRPIYLGASGLSCCQWCEELLTIAERVSDTPVRRYSSRGDYPDGWLIPQGINEAVKEKMIASIKHDAESVFKDLNRENGLVVDVSSWEPPDISWY